MTLRDIEKLRDKAQDQTGQFLATTIPITPGQMLDLCRLAEIGLLHEEQQGKPI